MYHRREVSNAVWFKLDDRIASDPVFLRLSPAAFKLWICGRCFINRELSNGKIPRPAITGFGIRYAATAAAELVSVGLWDARQAHYEDPTWQDAIESRERVTEKRAALADRVARWREKERQQREQSP
jgi:hypothetical protein